MRRLMLLLSLFAVNVAYSEEATNSTTPPVNNNKALSPFDKVKLLRQEGKLDEAQSAALDYLKIHPNDPDMQLLLGSVYYSKKDYQNAEFILNQGVQNYPNYKELSDLLAQVKKAEASQSGAVVSNTQNLDEMKTLAKVKELKNAGKLDEAESLAKEYLAQYPKDVDMQLLLASIYYNKKDYESAKSLLHEGMKNYPQYADLSTLLKSVENAERTPTLAPSGAMSAQITQGVTTANAIEKPNRIIFYQQSIYATSPDGYWDFTSLYYVRNTDWGNMLGAVNYASRYGQATAQGQIGSAVKLSKDVYVELNTTYADNLYIFPRYTLQGEIYFNVFNWFEFSIGDNYENISFTHFNAYTASLQKQIGQNSFSIRTYYFDPKAGPTSNYYIGNATRFIDPDETQFVSLTLGYGTTPDLADLQTVNFIQIDDRLIGLNYECPLVKDTLALNIGINYENQRFPSGTIRQLSGLSFALKTAF